MCYSKQLRHSINVGLAIFLAGCSISTPVATPTPSPPSAPPFPGTILAGKITASIPAGAGFQNPAAGEGAIWVPNNQDGTLSRIDPQTNQVVATIPIGNRANTGDLGVPTGIATGDGIVWVTQNDKRAVVPLDPKTNQLGSPIPVSVEPHKLAVSHGTLWIASFNQSTVVRIDTQTRQVVATIAHIDTACGIAASDTAIWVVSHRKDALIRIDPRTNQVVTTIPLGERSPGTETELGACEVMANSNGVWAPLAIGRIVRIDPQTNQVAATITIASEEDSRRTFFGGTTNIVRTRKESGSAARRSTWSFLLTRRLTSLSVLCQHLSHQWA